MLFLWVGMPALAIIMKLWGPSSNQQISGAVFSAILVSSLGSLLSSFMIVISILNEKSRNVYDLFLIKPIKRSDILLSKFFAVYLCVTIAGLFAVVSGIVIDIFNGNISIFESISQVKDPLILSQSMMAIACSAAILIGVLTNSILVGVIAILYGSNQLTGLSILPALMDIRYKTLIMTAEGIIFTTLFLFLSIKIFNKKQF